MQISGNTPNQDLTDFNQELKGLGTPSEKALEEKAENFITKHPSSLANIYLLDKYFVQKPQPNLEQIRKLADRMTGDLKDRPYMEALLTHIEEEEKVDIGKTAPYFRYRSRRPMIITTNLKLAELKNPPDLSHARIYLIVSKGSLTLSSLDISS